MNNKVYIIIYIVGIILIAGGFGYLGYNINYQENVQEKEEYVEVIYAKRSLDEGEEVTDQVIGITKMPKSLVGKMLQSKNELISYNVKYCVKENNRIVKDAAFYLDKLKVCDFDINEVKNNLLYLNVSKIEEFNNYKYEDMYDYVDINVKVLNNNGDIISDKLVENIPIVDILDQNNTSIYKSSEESKGEVLILDAIDEVYYLLNEAKYLRIEITPILKINSVNHEQQIVNEEIKNIIQENVGS